jgi:uncharacterized SAM-binding protein YcdF (DUF218 family)
VSADGGRVVVVLGYSERGEQGLHPVCRARLEAAARIARPGDTVVLSGWSRDGRTEPEAVVMRAAWRGTAARLVVDPDARTTAENAVNAVDDVRRSGATEVVVVTSRWHAARARAAFALALRGAGVAVRVASPPDPGRLRARLRELALWPLLPFQVRRGRRGSTRPRRGSAASPS